MPRTHPKTRRLSPLGEALITLMFLAAGGAIEAVAFGAIHVQPSAATAPRWVMALAGLLFLSAACLPQAARRAPDALLTRVIGALVFCSLSATVHWLAFGPGHPPPDGGLSVTALTPSATAPEHNGHVFFGCFAVLLDLVALTALVDTLRARRPFRARKAAGSP